MRRERAFYEFDRIEGRPAPTHFRTEERRYEIFCGTCGDAFFADEKTYRKFLKGMEMTLENRFVCEECGYHRADETFPRGL
ncbi:MAG: hypothetical protein R2684_09670 [Pyrinomonadaceae bacterium]